MRACSRRLRLPGGLLVVAACLPLLGPAAGASGPRVEPAAAATGRDALRHDEPADPCAPGPDAPPAELCAQLQRSRDRARQLDDQLSARQAALAGARAQLARADLRAAQLQEAVRSSEAAAAAAEAVYQRDRRSLGDSIRDRYERGAERLVAAIVASDSFQQAFDVVVRLRRLIEDERQLTDRVGDDARRTAEALAEAGRQRDAALVAQRQQRAVAALVDAEVEEVRLADSGAHDAVSQQQVQLAADRERRRQEELARRQHQGPVFGASAGGGFTVDTDLTSPSGLSAGQINGLLQGTALAGLGDAYMAAERGHHVNALYLLAHSILESGWGTSQIARDKHNLFGFGADDSNPYGDAAWFPSFAACIDQVSASIYRNYLVPSGPFYHGPTLRGMNVDYASDPGWASKIARIANELLGSL